MFIYRKITSRKPKGISQRQWNLIHSINYARNRVIIGNPFICNEKDEKYIIYGYRKLD